MPKHIKNGFFYHYSNQLFSFTHRKLNNEPTTLSSMKNIKIFLASSYELLAERERFEIEIAQKNDSWHKRGVRLQLHKWENLTAKMQINGSQSGYNEIVKAADIFVMLAYSKVGKYTEIEYDTALAQFKATEKPLMFVYFKDSKGIKTEPSLDAFKLRLENPQYFPPSFKDFNDLWNQFNKELDGLDVAQFEGLDWDKIRIQNSENTLIGNEIQAKNVRIGSDTIGQQTNIETQNITYVMPSPNAASDGVTSSHPVTAPPPTTQGFPRVLTQKPFISDFFIGRDTDLAAIDTNFQSKKLLVLINAEGGMGKTTLAAHYWAKHESRYAHLAWIFAERGVGNALVSLQQVLGVVFDQRDDQKAQVNRITLAIAQLNAPILLVLDNANDADDLETYLMVLKSLTNCHVLLTSRAIVAEDAVIQRILPLKIDFARQVFKNHYQKHVYTEGSLLDALLHAVGYNTLVIEVLAKNLAVANKYQTTYTLAALVADLQTKGLLALQNKPIKLVYQADALRTAEPADIIAAMYDINPLSDAERYLLSNFAVLPAENIPFDALMSAINPDGAADFGRPLSILEQKGWLEYREAENDFKISPVVQAIVQQKNAVLKADCQTLIDYLTEGLDIDNMGKPNYYANAAVYSDYAEAVIAAFKAPDDDIAILCERLGRYYTSNGNLDKTLFFYEKEKDIFSKLLHNQLDNHNFKNGLAASYSGLGETQAELGELDKALRFYEEFTNLMKELNATYSSSVDFKNGLAISYSKLGETHAALGNLDKTLGFYEERSRLSEELYAAYPSNVNLKKGLAVSYERLGLTHVALGNLDKVLSFYEKYNNLAKELYVTYPKNVDFKNGLAVSYGKLGETHAALGNLDKALGFYEEDIKLSKELYVAYPSNVGFKNGLAISYYKLGQFANDKLNDSAKARAYFQQAETLWIALVRDAPQYVSFQRFLAQVQRVLADLG
jgi:tetratricopeptide (TPR) repeat protein